MEKSYSYQKGFLENCFIYEKISSFYFHVKIKNRNTLVFYKANNKEIEFNDLLLNKMWNTPIQDFTKMFLSDKEFVEKCVGFTFSFFYFPVSNPLGIEYAENPEKGLPFRYILDHITLPNKITRAVGYINEFNRMDTKGLIRPFGICLKDDTRTEQEKKELINGIKSKNIKQFLDSIFSIIDTDKLCARSIDSAEGFILKSDSDVYQIINPVGEKPEVRNGRLALEIFVHSFVSFINNPDDFADCFVSNNYTTNVCHLLLKYKKWIEKDNNIQLLKFYNIKPSDLESPTFGYYGGTFYELIPVKAVRELCQKEPFWDNVFKILLNGLKKEKKFTPNDLILTKEDVKTWNALVGVFSMYDNIGKGTSLHRLILHNSTSIG